MNNWLFSNYQWFELWSPEVILIVGILAFIYHKKIALRFYSIQVRQIVCFYSALLLLYIVKGSPIHIIGRDYLFSVHITEIAITYFAVIPLLILSLPAAWLRKIFWHYQLRKMIKVFSHPWVAALIFNGVLTIYLVPRFFNTIHQHDVWSFLSQTILAITAFLMWWTIITPLKEVGEFSYFVRVAYVFLNSLLLMPMGIFLILSMFQPHYLVYDVANYQVFSSMNGIYDQQIAGALLKIIQLFCYGFALFFLIIRWGKVEEEKEDENIRVVQGVVIQLPERK